MFILHSKCIWVLINQIETTHITCIRYYDEIMILSTVTWFTYWFWYLFTWGLGLWYPYPDSNGIYEHYTSQWVIELPASQVMELQNQFYFNRYSENWNLGIFSFIMFCTSQSLKSVCQPTTTWVIYNWKTLIKNILFPYWKNWYHRAQTHLVCP